MTWGDRKWQELWPTGLNKVFILFIPDLEQSQSNTPQKYQFVKYSLALEHIFLYSPVEPFEMFLAFSDYLRIFVDNELL